MRPENLVNIVSQKQMKGISRNSAHRCTWVRECVA